MGTHTHLRHRGKRQNNKRKKARIMLQQLPVKEPRTSTVCKSLPRDIADNPENYTRFLCPITTRFAPTGKDKTSSIIFSAKHEPGSLYHALGEFAKRKINLTRIESRPTKKTAWEYNFYLTLRDIEPSQMLCRSTKSSGKICDFRQNFGFISQSNLIHFLNYFLLFFGGKSEA